MSVNPLSVPCPKCGKLPGVGCVVIQDCTSTIGNRFIRELTMLRPHKARVKAAEAAEGKK